MKLIVDTDAGHDDALAMLMLMSHCPEDILCFCGVAGNSTIENVARNIVAIQKLAQHENIPVHTGMPGPLECDLVVAKVHGKSGLDGLDMSGIEYDLDYNAPQRIVDLAHEYEGELIVLTLGPLSNVARALQIDSSIENKIKSIVMMGGAINVCGNQNRTAEFNIFVDPHAADIVFKSKIPKVLIPLDPCNDIIIPISVFDQLDGHRFNVQIKSLMEHFISGIVSEIGVKGALVYDALAAYYLIAPDAYTLEAMDVVIETKGEHTLGMAVAEKRLVANINQNVNVVSSIDGERFIKDMISLLLKL